MDWLVLVVATLAGGATGALVARWQYKVYTVFMHCTVCKKDHLGSAHGSYNNAEDDARLRHAATQCRGEELTTTVRL